MEKLQHLEKSVVVVVEWIPGEMEAWAKLNQAYNVVTGEVMDAGLNESAIELFEQIVFEGYKGWTDEISERIVRGCLDELVQIGAYDRALVLAYARQSKHEASIERLKKILDTFDANAESASAEPHTWQIYFEQLRRTPRPVGARC